MLFALLQQLLNPDLWFRHPLYLFGAIFQIWMMVDAIRREEWIWLACIFFFSVVSAILYFAIVWWPQRGRTPEGTFKFEWPGAADRKRIRELQARIHHLDNASHHAELGEIYLKQGKLKEAEVSFRNALQRDPSDLDTVGRLGRCLALENRLTEARPLLEKVTTENPRHDYGETLMALAEIQTRVGEKDRAIQNWKRVLENSSYARARVQLAELLINSGQRGEALPQLMEAIHDDAQAPRYLRAKDKGWIRRARELMGKTS